MILNIKYKNITKRSFLHKDSEFSLKTDESWFNKNTQSEDVPLQDLAKIVEKSNVLNYPYDFLSLDGLNNIIPSVININLVDNVNININEDVFEHYNRDTGEITLTEKLLYNDQIAPNTFPEHLYKTVGQSKLLNYAFLHEIGHAVHHQLFLKQEINYLIPSDSFNEHYLLNLIANNGLYVFGKNKDSRRFDINHSINYAIKEGFADMYACIGILQIYPRDAALSFIDEVISARKNSYDYYYTTESLKKLKNDISNKVLKLNSFDDTHQYINNTVADTALNEMINKLSSGDTKQVKYNNAFAGFLKAIVEKCYEQNVFDSNFLEDKNSVNEVIEILDLSKNKLNVDISNLKEDSDSFTLGYKATMNDIDFINHTNFLTAKLSKNSINNKIQSMRNFNTYKSSNLIEL